MGLQEKNMGRRPPFCQAAGHIEAGAKKVIISAPGKGDLKTLASLKSTEMMFSDMALSEIGTSFGHFDREDDNAWELVVPNFLDTHL
jgi:hypothetical protein